jgi:hypothetical protein
MSFSVTHQSALGSIALPVSVSINKDTVRPLVAFSSPAENSVVTIANHTAFVIAGSCSESGRNVDITGQAPLVLSATVPCAAGAFTATVDVSAAVEGPFTLNANQSDVAGNSSTPASRAFIHELKPALSILLPVAGSYVNLANRAAFSVSGTCGANGQNVTFSIATTPAYNDQALCTAGVWSKNLNFTTVADGPFVLQANLLSATGTPADPVNLSFNKDVVPPTLTVVSPVNGSSTSAIDVVLNGTCTTGLTVNLSYTALQGPANIVCVGGLYRSSLALDDGPLVNGMAHSVSVSTSDLAGNSVTIARNISSVRPIEPMGHRQRRSAVGRWENSAGRVVHGVFSFAKGKHSRRGSCDWKRSFKDIQWRIQWRRQFGFATSGWLLHCWWSIHKLPRTGRQSNCASSHGRSARLHIQSANGCQWIQ